MKKNFKFLIIFFSSILIKNLDSLLGTTYATLGTTLKPNESITKKVKHSHIDSIIKLTEKTANSKLKGFCCIDIMIQNNFSFEVHNNKHSS